MEMEPYYCSIIKQALKTSDKSMRQLAKETDINVSTISRILNGKRKATLQHLQAISASLHIPLSELLDDKEEKKPVLTTFQYVKEVMKAMNLPTKDFTEDKLVRYLKHCENESNTDKGKKTIKTHFKNKLSYLNAEGPFIEHLEVMYKKFQEKKYNKREMLLIGSALFYFITSMDLVPDYLFPVGYLDDALAVQYVMQSLTNNI